MSRLMFTVAASTAGWQLCEGLERRLWFARRSEALATADLMARILHANHGIATAVLIEMVGRDSVMVAAHG